MPSSSNHSKTIPLSFDRFRTNSIQFLSPFRNHKCDRRIQQSPERSWTRKIQVHPNDIQSSESEKIDHDAAYLFNANNNSNSKTSSLSKNAKNKKYADNLFDTRPTTNVMGVFDVCKLSAINASHPSEPNIIEHIYPPTPSMIEYRYGSLPNLIPTRVIKRPTSFDQSMKQSDCDQFNTK